MEIKCPHCGQIFDMSNSTVDHIKEQVRSKIFKKELDDQVKFIKKAYETETDRKVSEAVAEEKAKSSDKISVLKGEISALETRIQIMETQSDVAVQKKELDVKTEYSDKIAKLEAEKKSIEYERDYYKDLKAKMSTKMVGETLEQHCEIEFNKIRMAAFPNADFGKDNVVSKQSGSKGDYIFREYDPDGNELISIMFEMKNEMDTTASKHTNKSFFKELDKDRKEKKCEYAVLVSMLEADNEYYNQGIVDVSYEYPKMYVIRPQFFIPLITILRNAALSSLEIRKELMIARNQNIDVKHFEDAFTKFRTGFSYNYEQASKRFDEAISEIDKTIDHLNKVKSALLASDKQLRFASNKLDDVDMKKLTANSPSLKAQLEEN